MKILPAVEMESPSGIEVNASIIWLHGLGANGDDFAPIVPQLNLPLDFGIKQMDIDRHVDDEQLKQSAQWVHNLINRELERGVVSERIIVAGFSQGGAVSFEAALTYEKPLAGIMALSTYFATAHTIEINPLHSSLPILICHGALDPVVPESMGKQSLTTLQNLKFEPEYKSYPMEHAVCPQEISDIGAWIARILA